MLFFESNTQKRKREDKTLILTIMEFSFFLAVGEPGENQSFLSALYSFAIRYYTYHMYFFFTKSCTRSCPALPT